MIMNGAVLTRLSILTERNEIGLSFPAIDVVGLLRREKSATKARRSVEELMVQSVSSEETRTTKTIEGVVETEMFSDITPLEAVVGFQVAEETYDMLTMREQIIVDLLCAGFTHAEIGSVFNVSQPSISSSVRRLRYKLADGKLQLVLEARQGLRENRYGTK